MKWKNSFKKGSHAAFVTLALTGSALAMPTGGTVENGSVNVDAANFGANDAIANVANGATITPQTNSIINWEAFNIAQGEALHFNTTNAALLNRVTGAQMSELLGQMTQVGGNFLYLVNPNGIHIGELRCEQSDALDAQCSERGFPQLCDSCEAVSSFAAGCSEGCESDHC